MSCDRDICATNEYNGIGCDECCVSYDTAAQREQDAYDSGFGKAIDRMLEIIDTVNDDLVFGTRAKGVALSIKEKVLALKENMDEMDK